MSSPIAKPNKRIVDKALVTMHKILTSDKRYHALAREIGRMLKKNFCSNKELTGLDVGCGDMLLAELIVSANHNLTIKCTDLYDLPKELAGEEKWQKYVKFDGSVLPFTDNSFDLVFFNDVLHHVGSDEKICALLREASRVADFLVIKDHFEYGSFSRSLLRTMDFVGNYGYGISVPKKYFTKDNFINLLDRCNLEVLDQLEDIKLYDNRFFSSLGINDYHFISLVGRK